MTVGNIRTIEEIHESIRARQQKKSGVKPAQLPVRETYKPKPQKAPKAAAKPAQVEGDWPLGPVRHPVRGASARKLMALLMLGQLVDMCPAPSIDPLREWAASLHSEVGFLRAMAEPIPYDAIWNGAAGARAVRSGRYAAAVMLLLCTLDGPHSCQHVSETLHSRFPFIPVTHGRPGLPMDDNIRICDIAEAGLIAFAAICGCAWFTGFGRREWSVEQYAWFAYALQEGHAQKIATYAQIFCADIDASALRDAAKNGRRIFPQDLHERFEFYRRHLRGQYYVVEYDRLGLRPLPLLKLAEDQLQTLLDQPSIRDDGQLRRARLKAIEVMREAVAQDEAEAVVRLLTIISHVTRSKGARHLSDHQRNAYLRELTDIEAQLRDNQRRAALAIPIETHDSTLDEGW